MALEALSRVKQSRELYWIIASSPERQLAEEVEGV